MELVFRMSNDTEFHGMARASFNYLPFHEEYENTMLKALENGSAVIGGLASARESRKNIDKKDADLRSKQWRRNRIVNPDQQQMVVKAEADSQDAARSVPAKRKGRAGGLHKVCGVTPQIQVIVGQQALPRTEIVKQVLAYIRRNNLQDPNDRRRIICDDAVSAVLETNGTDMFQMNKLLSKHIIQLEPPNEEEESNQAKKLKVGSVDGQSPTGNGEPGPQKWMQGLLAFG